MQSRRWLYMFLAAAIGLLGVAVLLSQPVSAQSPESNTSERAVSAPNSSVPVGSSASPNIVLFDQYNNAAPSASGSQNFESSYNAYDDFVADDFVVPAGQVWSMNLAEVKGQYWNGTGPADSMNVFLYSNAITLPGTLVAAQTNLTYTTNVSATDFVIPLGPPIVLSPGAYWISVQANQAYSPTGQWGWTDRTITTTRPAAWQNPGNGFGSGCTTWKLRTICIPSSAAGDQVFRLSGTQLTVQFSAATYTVNEGAGSVTITATLSAASPLTATVNFAISNGTAIAGSDYVAASGTLTFTPGTTSQTFNVSIIDDALFEENETVNLVLSSPTGATIVPPNPAVLTIVDNDPPPPMVCGSGAPGPWVLRSFLPQPVYGASVTSADPYAYAIGGYSFLSASDVTQTARYNPATNSWTPLAPLPNAVTLGSAVYAPINNKLYVFGGERTVTSQVFSTTLIYDISGNSWSTGAPMPDIRAFMGSGYYNGKIYLVGGYSTGSVTPAYTQTWEYDVVANTWVTKTGMPQALGGPASAVVNGHLYIIGGRNGSSEAITQTYDYDIAGDTWFTRASIPTGVNVPGTAVFDGKVWVIGGGSPFLMRDGSSSLASINAPETFTTTQIYDPIGNSWSPGPSLNIQRSFLGATGFGNFIVAIGGYNGIASTGATEVTWKCPNLYLPIIIKNSP